MFNFTEPLWAPPEKATTQNLCHFVWVLPKTNPLRQHFNYYYNIIRINLEIRQSNVVLVITKCAQLLRQPINPFRLSLNRNSKYLLTHAVLILSIKPANYRRRRFSKKRSHPLYIKMEHSFHVNILQFGQSTVQFRVLFGPF